MLFWTFCLLVTWLNLCLTAGNLHIANVFIADFWGKMLHEDLTPSQISQKDEQQWHSQDPVNYRTDMTSLGAANLGEFWGKRRNGRPLGSFIYVLVVNLVSLGWAAEPGKTYSPVFGRFENERRSEACVQCVAGMLISGLVRDFIENEPWVIFNHLGFIPGFILCNLECRRNLHFLEAAFRPNWTAGRVWWIPRLHQSLSHSFSSCLSRWWDAHIDVHHFNPFHPRKLWHDSWCHHPIDFHLAYMPWPLRKAMTRLIGRKCTATMGCLEWGFRFTTISAQFVLSDILSRLDKLTAQVLGNFCTGTFRSFLDCWMTRVFPSGAPAH